ncbi:MAG: glutamate-5-semialdehyde dehydrogenase [Oscillospiraceae bacterium]
MSLQTILQQARQAKYEVAQLTEDQRNTLLETMAHVLLQQTNAILAANAKDIENARGKIANVMLDRLRLDTARIQAVADGIRAVAALKSPLGEVEKETQRPNGLQIRKVRVPIGVIAIIYESRPNVTTDAAALCIKSGNACILRGSSDAIYTNTAIAAALHTALVEANAPVYAVQLLEDTSHETARQLMAARGWVDLLIPRGGKNLIAAVVEGAQGVPVIETGTGICHVYVDKSANLQMAADILDNAKTTRPSVCNSAEVCLVHKDVASQFLPIAKQKLAHAGVEFRLDPASASIIEGTPAGPEDFDTEFLDYVLAVHVVNSTQEAIEHINAHSTGHSEAIVTEDGQAAASFCAGVDSAAVYVNASTRFTDGGEFGLGCEMGISTQKIGARGPMGLYELTSYKYIIEGNGQIR